MDKRRSKRRIKEGIVTSDKMDKTIVVRVGRLAKHAKYGRMIRLASKFKVDDQENKARQGDKVRIAQVRPLSKEKRWRLIEVVK
jgi:small subunit ribosomal protein S17